VTQHTNSTSTGNDTVSGVGFLPESVVAIGVNSSGSVPSSATVALLGVGFGNFVDQAAAGVFSEDAAGTSGADRHQSAGNIITQLSATGGATDGVASLQSANSDGFAINWASAGSSARTHFLAMRGVGTSVINDGSVPGSTGLQTLGVLGAKAGLFLMTGQSTSDAVAAHNVLSVGVTDGASQSAAAITDADAAGTTDANREWSESRIIQENSSAGATIAEAEVDDLSAGSINWTDSGAGSSYFACLFSDPVGGAVLTARRAVGGQVLRNREWGRIHTQS
jgi:hypothetical protein